MEKEYKGYAARIALLVVLPFLFGAFFLPHTQEMDGQVMMSPEEMRSGEDLSYSFNHSGDDILATTRVNAIFPLANYLNFPPLVNHYAPELCFQDNDSFLLLSDGQMYDPEFSWIIDINNETRLVVAPDGMNCTPLAAGSQTNYKWYVRMALPTNDSRFKGNVTFVPQTRTFPRMTMDYGLLQGLVMIPVAFLFLWYPAAGIWKKIRKGLLEQ